MPIDPAFMVWGDPRLSRAVQHVIRDLARRPTLAETSKVAGLERTYFCKWFRKSLGVSFSEWNTRIRVEEAQDLLRTTQLTVSAVALAVGYHDVTTFERNFRKIVAVSPRQYRQQQARQS